MYGVEVIKHMNRKRGKIARVSQLQPTVPQNIAEKSLLYSMRNFGSYRPSGWRLVKTHFVDNSGFGQVGEPALTYPEFIKKAKVGRGYAIISTGQFQVKIGEFVRILK